MIGQNSNNRNVGTQPKDCDAGIPIMGRTGGNPTDSYQIIKTDYDGVLIGFPKAVGGQNYQGFFLGTFAVPGGAPPANTFLGICSNTFNVSADGQYQVNPVLIYPGAPGGGISFVLYKDFTAMGAYISTLPPFNAFNPSSADVTNGLYGYWHNSVSQNFGGALMYAYNRDNTLSTYLTVGQYNIAAITDGATNFAAGTAQIGFNEFVKIG